MRTLNLSEEEFRSVYNLSYSYEPWNRSHDSFDLMRESYNRGNIYTYSNGNTVVGYAEVWRIDHNQMERILKNAFDIKSEETSRGAILWIANVTFGLIHRGDRHMVSSLKNRIFEDHQDAEFVGGEYSGTRERSRNHKLIPMRRIRHGIKKG